MAAMRSGHRSLTAHAASRGPAAASAERVLATRSGPGARAGRRFRVGLTVAPRARHGGRWSHPAKPPHPAVVTRRASPPQSRRATSARRCAPRAAAAAVGAVVGGVRWRRQRWSRQWQRAGCSCSLWRVAVPRPRRHGHTAAAAVGAAPVVGGGATDPAATPWLRRPPPSPSPLPRRQVPRRRQPSRRAPLPTVYGSRVAPKRNAATVVGRGRRVLHPQHSS